MYCEVISEAFHFNWFYLVAEESCTCMKTNDYTFLLANINLSVFSYFSRMLLRMILSNLS